MQWEVITVNIGSLPEIPPRFGKNGYWYGQVTSAFCCLFFHTTLVGKKDSTPDLYSWGYCPLLVPNLPDIMGKGEGSVHAAEDGNRELLTVLVTVSAGGEILPLLMKEQKGGLIGFWL